MMTIAILYEHPIWHQPLFDALDKAEIKYIKVDLKNGALELDNLPEATLYYNLVSPSAYLRNNLHSISYSYSLCNILEYQGRTVLNGSNSMKIELSKSRQLALLRKLNIDFPHSVVFNNLQAVSKLKLNFPLILKPEQGGSGARMYQINSMKELTQIFEDIPDLWQPDYLMLLQEKLDYDPDIGIIRLEFVNDKLIYAMRVVTNGAFNLCPSVACNPEEGNGVCNIDDYRIEPPKFYAFKDVNQSDIDKGKKIMNEAGHFSGSVEYVVCRDGRTVFYDINSNSNLRESIGLEFGQNPFEFVVNELRLMLNSSIT